MRKLNPIEQIAHALIDNRSTTDFPFADFMADNPQALIWKNAMKEAEFVWNLARAATLEEAAKVAEWAHMVPPDGGSPSEEECEVAREAAKRIRALSVEG